MITFVSITILGVIADLLVAHLLNQLWNILNGVFFFQVILNVLPEFFCFSGKITLRNLRININFDVPSAVTPHISDFNPEFFSGWYREANWQFALRFK